MTKFTSQERGVDFFIVGVDPPKPSFTLLPSLMIRPYSFSHSTYYRGVRAGKINWADDLGSPKVDGWSKDPWPNDFKEFCEEYVGRWIKLRSFE